MRRTQTRPAAEVVTAEKPRTRPKKPVRDKKALHSVLDLFGADVFKNLRGDRRDLIAPLTKDIEAAERDMIAAHKRWLIVNIRRLLLFPSDAPVFSFLDHLMSANSDGLISKRRAVLQMRAFFRTPDDYATLRSIDLLKCFRAADVDGSGYLNVDTDDHVAFFKSCLNALQVKLETGQARYILVHEPEPEAEATPTPAKASLKIPDPVEESSSTEEEAPPPPKKAVAKAPPPEPVKAPEPEPEPSADEDEGEAFFEDEESGFLSDQSFISSSGDGFIGKPAEESIFHGEESETIFGAGDSDSETVSGRGSNDTQKKKKGKGKRTKSFFDKGSSEEDSGISVDEDEGVDDEDEESGGFFGKDAAGAKGSAGAKSSSAKAASGPKGKAGGSKRTR